VSRGLSVITQAARASATLPSYSEAKLEVGQPLHDAPIPLSPATRVSGTAHDPVFDKQVGSSTKEGSQDQTKQLPSRIDKTNSQEQYDSRSRKSTESTQDSATASRGTNRGAMISRHAEGARHHTDAGSLPASRDTARTLQGRNESHADDEDDDEDEEDEEADGEPKSVVLREATASRSLRPDESNRTPEMFLPGKGISQEILEYHKKRGTFGTWTSIARTRRNSEDGFLISFTKDTRPLDVKQIKRIVNESSIHEAKKKDMGRPSRTR